MFFVIEVKELLKYCLFFGGYFLFFLHVSAICLNIYFATAKVLDFAKLLGIPIFLFIWSTFSSS
jgi:hypothetical protein